MSEEPFADAGPALGHVDHTCDEHPLGGVCLFFERQNPAYASPDLVQIDIRCGDPRIVNWDRCVAFSYDPEVFTYASWAFCCLPMDAGTVR